MTETMTWILVAIILAVSVLLVSSATDHEQVMNVCTGIEEWPKG